MWTIMNRDDRQNSLNRRQIEKKLANISKKSINIHHLAIFHSFIRKTSFIKMEFINNVSVYRDFYKTLTFEVICDRFPWWFLKTKLFFNAIFHVFVSEACSLSASWLNQQNYFFHCALVISFHFICLGISKWIWSEIWAWLA